ncbi:MAG: cation:proton antiporter, partial [Cyanobacteria bacterium P01_H01_bin.58]
MTINPEPLALISIVLPLFVGFSIYLLPRLSRVLAIATAFISLGYGLWYVLNPTP